METNAQALGNRLPGLMFRLANSVDRAERIDLRKWLRLDLDERAPVQSVVMFDIVGGQLNAVVFNTVTDQLDWWIVARPEEMAMLYLGVLGEAGAPGVAARGTLMVSAPRSCPTNAALRSGSRPEKIASFSELPLNDVVPESTGDEDPKPALPGGGGGSGPKGRLLSLIAELFVRVAQTMLVTINDKEVGVVGMTELMNKRF
jgi:hypothetical protein